MTPPRPGIAVLMSGGLDSAVLLGRLAARPARAGRLVPLYVRCGLRWERAELHWARAFCRALPPPRPAPLTVLTAPAAPLWGGRARWAFRGAVPGSRAPDRAVELPGRNLLLLTVASIYAASHGLGTVAIGTLRGNPFGDATSAFFRAWPPLTRLALGVPIRMAAPFRRLTKAEVLARGRGLPLHLTFSCLRPRGLRPCNHCNKCGERTRALSQRD